MHDHLKMKIVYSVVGLFLRIHVHKTGFQRNQRNRDLRALPDKVFLQILMLIEKVHKSIITILYIKKKAKEEIRAASQKNHTYALCQFFLENGKT